MLCDEVRGGNQRLRKEEVEEGGETGWEGERESREVLGEEISEGSKGKKEKKMEKKREKFTDRGEREDWMIREVKIGSFREVTA